MSLSLQRLRNEKVTYDAVALTLKSKYVMLLLDSVVGNGWKSEQACTIIKPWYEAFKEKHDGARPSNKQIRAKAKELTLEDYVFNLSIDWLKSLEQERIALAYAQISGDSFPDVPRVHKMLQRIPSEEPTKICLNCFGNARRIKNGLLQ